MVGGLTSKAKKVSCGVPQGSVLGPLLFIVYINSVVFCLQHATYYMYADDLAIAVCNKDPDIVRALLQDELDRVSNWCSNFKLTVNSDKTHILWCKSETDVRNYGVLDIWLSGKKIHTVDIFNYLGIIIDSRLLFVEHCTKVRVAGRVKLTWLRRIKKYIDFDLALF